jgi:hypothetical protein
MNNSNIHLHLHCSGHYDISIQLKDQSLAGRIDIMNVKLDHLGKGQAEIMLTTQDLQAKADAAAAANNQLIALTKEQAQMLRDALASGDPAAQQAAMQAVADTLDGITSSDTAEIAADTVRQADPNAQPGA